MTSHCQQCHASITRNLLCAACATWLRFRCEICQAEDATTERIGVRCCADCAASHDA